MRSSYCRQVLGGSANRNAECRTSQAWNAQSNPAPLPSQTEHRAQFPQMHPTKDMDQIKIHSVHETEVLCPKFVFSHTHATGECVHVRTYMSESVEAHAWQLTTARPKKHYICKYVHTYLLRNGLETAGIVVRDYKRVCTHQYMLMSDSRQSRLTWQETKVSTARSHDTTVLHTAPRWRFWVSPGPLWSWSDSGGRLSRDDHPPACGSRPGSAWSAATKGDGEHLDRNSWPMWIHPQDEEACEHITHTQLTSLNRVAKVYPSQEPKKNIKKINNWQPQQQCASWVHLHSMEPPCALLA